MRISKLWPGYAIAVTLLATACGGGSTSSTPATAAPTTAPTATPTPSPGPLLVGYSLAPTLGSTAVAATAAPPAIGFAAETQTAAVTASQANYTGSFTAAATGCGANVTVTPATSTTGAFTVTAVGPQAAGCSITFGGSGTTTVAVGATVPAPGPLQLFWVSNAALGTAVAGQTVTPLAGPINLPGTGVALGGYLIATKTGYIGAFSNSAPSAACTGKATVASAPSLTPPTTLGTLTALGSTQAYYAVAGVAAIATSPTGCNITVTDSAVNTIPANGTATIGVSVTTSSGGIL